MWTALALTTVLMAPAQTGELKVSNVRSTYGILGPTRKDKDLLPGDMLVVAFDIENLTVKPDGSILYSLGMELTKKGKNKSEFKRDPQDLQAVNNLGGTTLPAFAMMRIGTQTSPGEYVLAVTVSDRGVKPAKTTTLEYAFTVKPLELGFIAIGTTNGAGEPVPPIAVPGQNIWLHYALVGYKTDINKQPFVSVEMQILDSEGNPCVKTPFKEDFRVDSKESPGVMAFRPSAIQLNRAGKFKIVLKAEDKIAKKKTELTLELEVLSR